METNLTRSHMTIFFSLVYKSQKMLKGECVYNAKFKGCDYTKETEQVRSMFF